MNKILLIIFFTVYSSVISAAIDEERDVELLSNKIVEYFKKVASETEKPISLKITLSDAYGAGTSIEDEKDLTLDSFPRSVSRSFVMGILEELGDLLHDFLEGRDAASLSLKTTIWVNATNHREKANGFCSLGTE